MEHRSPGEIRTYVAPGSERLERLASILDTLPPERLTFSRWYGDGKGCAIGLAATIDPWFQAQGLRLEHDHSLKDCHPVYDGATDWSAAASFFELSHKELRDLFDQTGYDGEMRPHPQRVASRIRKLLASKA